MLPHIAVFNVTKTTSRTFRDVPIAVRLTSVGRKKLYLLNSGEEQSLSLCGRPEGIPKGTNTLSVLAMVVEWLTRHGSGVARDGDTIQGCMCWGHAWFHPRVTLVSLLWIISL